MPLDRSQLDTLIGNLESGAVTLQSATDANTAAQTQAATCKAALDAATAANQQNVQALKSFVQALDPDGNDPAAPPTPTPAGGTVPGVMIPVPGDSGASAAPGGDGAAVVPPTPAEGPAATGTAPATAVDQPTA